MSRAYLTHSGQKIDILFVDGDHTSRGCVRDFNTLHGHMRNGGYVIFHDIYPKMCGWKGPRLVLDCLKAAKRPLAQFDIRERTDLDPFGVAVCRMISPGRNPLVACSWMRKMDLWVKTSKVMKLIELMIFEAKLPASHRNFLRRMGTLSKEIFHSRILPKL